MDRLPIIRLVASVAPWGTGKEMVLPCPARHNGAVPYQLMIKIISYVVIAFYYMKANIICRWSNILLVFNGNNGLCHSCRSY